MVCAALTQCPPACLPACLSAFSCSVRGARVRRGAAGVAGTKHGHLQLQLPGAWIGCVDWVRALGRVVDRPRFRLFRPLPSSPHTLRLVVWLAPTTTTTSQLFAFLGVGTTNLIARNAIAAPGLDDRAR